MYERTHIEGEQMIIDSHGHVTAPEKLYVYKANVLSHRGAHGRGSHGASDEEIKGALNAPVFGGSSHLQQLKEVGTDMQIISPRPYQMMHSEDPKVVRWFIEETNDIIYKQTKLYPNVFRGVCGLPQSPGVSPKECLPYLEKLVKEQAGRPLLVSAVRKTVRAGCSRPHSFGWLPLAPPDLFPPLHQ